MDLAPGWSIAKVLGSLRQKDRVALVEFLAARYNTRFFEPIDLLHKASIDDFVRSRAEGKDDPSLVRSYGFAILSLACSLVETIESYQRGIPTTSTTDLDNILRDYPPPPNEISCDRSDVPGVGKAFQSFFGKYGREFNGLSGTEFYSDIRNALLHQSQTRHGWSINIHDPAEAIIKSSEIYAAAGSRKWLYRDSFVFQLKTCFDRYLEELRSNVHNDDLWGKAERKIWWIAWLSDPKFVTDWVKGNP